MERVVIDESEMRHAEVAALNPRDSMLMLGEEGGVLIELLGQRLFRREVAIQLHGALGRVLGMP